MENDRYASVKTLLHLENELNFDRDIPRQLTDACGGARVPPRFAEHICEKLGTTIDNHWLIIEIRGTRDKTEHLYHVFHLITRAKRIIQYSQYINSADSRRFLSLFQR